MNFKNHKSIFEYIISYLMILEKICQHNGADHSQYFKHFYTTEQSVKENIFTLK